MASLERDRSGNYLARFRWASQPYKRSLDTRDPELARIALSRAEETITRLKRGWLSLPEGADPAAFIVSGGELTGKPAPPIPPVIVRPMEKPRLSDLLGTYARGINPGAKERNSLETEAIHRGHLTRGLGDLVVEEIDFDSIQGYVKARSEEGRDPVTIRKELATLRMIWNWALRRGRITSPLPWRMGDLEFSKTSVKEPFQTWEEIERRIARDRLKGEAAALWESLYLDEEQIKECLEYVREHAAYPFVHPMFCLAAYTGARRGEILRSVWDDFRFDSGTVGIRQKKSDRAKHFTFRNVPLHPDLSRVMQSWYKIHPGGPYTICTANQQPIGERMATKYFRATLKGSKWEVLHGFHAFRHSLASIMASKGIDQRVINEILGHSTEEMVRRYRHLFPRRKEETIHSLFT
jgi:integrase